MFTQPILAQGINEQGAILVRMSDKIQRLKNLSDGKEVQVSSEAFEDTMMDLGVYAFLYCISLKR